MLVATVCKHISSSLRTLVLSWYGSCRRETQSYKLHYKYISSSLRTLVFSWYGSCRRETQSYKLHYKYIYLYHTVTILLILFYLYLAVFPIHISTYRLPSNMHYTNYLTINPIILYKGVWILYVNHKSSFPFHLKVVKIVWSTDDDLVWHEI